ncbi:cytochrome c-type biogenesis protein CcmH [Actinomycetota bacterium]
MSASTRQIIGWVVTIGLAAVVVVGMIMGDTRDDDRVASLGAAIKCPVCQGEAIVDSPSETAQAMLEVLEEKVAEGLTDDQVFAYFTDRYGDGIRLDPRFSPQTLLLWLTPVIAVAGGVWMILSRRRQPELVSEEAP